MTNKPAIRPRTMFRNTFVPEPGVTYCAPCTFEYRLAELNAGSGTVMLPDVAGAVTWLPIMLPGMQIPDVIPVCMSHLPIGKRSVLATS